MDRKQYKKLASLVKKYYKNDHPMSTFVSTLQGEERAIMEQLLQGIETEQTDRVIVHCLNVLSVRMKHPDSPYGYYHKK